METQSKVLKASLIIGIVIVLNLFFNYALSLAYKHPVYENYCPVQQVNEAVTTKEVCVEQGGQWNATQNEQVPVNITPTFTEWKAQSTGGCDLQFSCRNSFEAAQKVYDRNVFITLVILGAICVAVGSFLSINVLISIALSMAGVLSFIIASMRYWGSADDLIKVIILAIALSILVWVAMKKFKDSK
ncbi:MAG TPA: hypothetical protein VGO63_02300 [Candidatus Paceibacterota bacterium]|jgi:hypothetical protein|nr:hypothetical protein [Candidatus Paceibacterota bacterium]